MKKLFMILIRFYQRYISPCKPPCCRFIPTCSQYAYTAIKEWGVIVGSLMGIWRILRCNPLVPGGVDHVPLKGAKKRSVEGYTVFYGRSPYSRFCGDGRRSAASRAIDAKKTAHRAEGDGEAL